jgi:hypothetical protein
MLGKMGFQWCKRCVQILQFEYENTLQILKFEQDICGILGGKKLPVIFILFQHMFIFKKLDGTSEIYEK